MNLPQAETEINHDDALRLIAKLEAVVFALEELNSILVAQNFRLLNELWEVLKFCEGRP